MSRLEVRQVSRQKGSEGPHPVWNALGCLMLVVVPAISIALSVVVLQVIQANKWPFPYQLMGYPRFPDFLYSTKGLSQLFGAIDNIQNLYAYIAISLIIMVIVGGILSFVYALIYRFVGPSKYGPTDAPPVKLKVTKKQR